MLKGVRIVEAIAIVQNSSCCADTLRSMARYLSRAPKAVKKPVNNVEGVPLTVRLTMQQLGERRKKTCDQHTNSSDIHEK